MSSPKIEIIFRFYKINQTRRMFERWKIRKTPKKESKTCKQKIFVSITFELILMVDRVSTGMENR